MPKSFNSFSDLVVRNSSTIFENELDRILVYGYNYPPFRKTRELSENYYLKYEGISEYTLKTKNFENIYFKFSYEYQINGKTIKGIVD